MLTFQEDTHQYFYSGKEVPGVSRFLETCELKPVYKLNDLSYAIKGSEVHKLTEALDRDILSIDDLDKHEHLGYIEAWIKFKNDFGYLSLSIEHKVFNENYWLAGTVDRVGSTEKHKSVTIDIKTGSKQGWHKYQLAAYNILMGVSNARLIVYLNSNGEYKVTECKNDDDYRIVKENMIVYKGAII